MGSTSAGVQMMASCTKKPDDTAMCEITGLGECLAIQKYSNSLKMPNICRFPANASSLGWFT